MYPNSNRGTTPSMQLFQSTERYSNHTSSSNSTMPNNNNSNYNNNSILKNNNNNSISENNNAEFSDAQLTKIASIITAHESKIVQRLDENNTRQEKLIEDNNARQEKRLEDHNAQQEKRLEDNNTKQINLFMEALDAREQRKLTLPSPTTHRLLIEPPPQGSRYSTHYAPYYPPPTHDNRYRYPTDQHYQVDYPPETISPPAQYQYGPSDPSKRTHE